MELLSLNIKQFTSWHMHSIFKYAYEILRKLDFLNIAEKSKVSGYIDRILEDSRLI